MNKPTAFEIAERMYRSSKQFRERLEEMRKQALRQAAGIPEELREI